MSSATPTRPGSTPSLAAFGVGALVAVVVVIAVVWLLAAGGVFAAFGRWLHESGIGTALRYILESLALLICVLLSTAALIYVERKIWGAVQIRRGPNVVGPWGVLQPFADFGKFMLKEPIIPAGANKGVFVMAPLVSVILAFSAWAVIPVADGWVVADINVAILYLFAVSSLGVYGVIMAGWASNSKYPLLSALRAAAQMVSYEVSIGFVIVTVVMCAGSLNLSDIVLAQDTRFGFLGWYWLPLLPMFIIFFISSMAETNRPPFDLTEAESELVAGYQVEYSGSLFLLQYLTELVALLTMAAMTAVLFLGGWLSPLPFPPFTWIPGVFWFLIKAWGVVFCYSVVKAFVPRYRYDQLMRLGWKVFLPISLVMVVLVAAVLEFTGAGAHVSG
jgi:NADH-quinone oxidoreductase subunit H